MKSLKYLNTITGFTFVETLVTVLLYVMIAAACYTALIAGNSSWQLTSTMVELQQEFRKAMDFMTDDLRQAGSASITNVPADGVWYNTITFKKCNGVAGGNISWAGNTVQYVLGTGAGANRLLHKSGGQDKVIAQDIQTLQIRRSLSTPNLVEVSLLAQKNTSGGKLLSFNSNFSVRLRN